MTDNIANLPIRAPRSTKAAQELAERFAEIDGLIAVIEERRNAEIAAANKQADEDQLGLIRARDAITAKLEAWWPGAAEALTKGERKSIELGGCMIGTVSQRDSLGVDGDEKAIVAALEKHDWAEPLLKVKTTLDKVAILKSIDGAYKVQLRKLGLSRKEGVDAFFIKRTEQGGTRAGAVK